MDELGIIPPQNIDFENAVIGAIMLEKDALLKVCNILKIESFYKESNSIIYKTCLDLFTCNNPVDLLTVAEKLRVNKNLLDAGGYLNLVELTSHVNTSAHIEYHARIIHQKYIQREFIRISSEIQRRAYEYSEDVQDLIDYVETELLSISSGSIKKEPKIISQIGKEQLKILEELENNEFDFNGIPSGIKALDKMMNGFQSKKLIIIAARPAMGKTTLLITLAKNMSLEYKKKIAIFSLEMGEDELWKKFISSLTDIQYAKLSNKIGEKWNEIEKAQSKLEKCDIYVDDTAGLNIFELKSKLKRLKIKHNIDIVFIDYLQLMSGSHKGNRENEISEISRSLKNISKELDISVVALSQLNRSCELRPDKKPQLSDLRESGAIEQDADIVAFIYRPEYYGFMSYEDNETTVNKVEILIRKNRCGVTGDVIINRTAGFSRIYDDIENINDNKDLKYNDSDYE